MQFNPTVRVLSFVVLCILLLWLPASGQQVAVVGSDRFYVLGEVEKPGDFEFKPSTTVKSAIQTAGGLTARADKTGGVLLHGETKTAVDVGAILDGKKPDIPVQSGDTLLVKPGTFKVEGRVAKPGSYDIRANLTAAQAVAMAGQTVEGADLKGCYIVRDGKTITVDLTVAETPEKSTAVHTGDVLTVPEMSVTVTGEVARPGMYPLIPGKTDKLLDAIAAAGGITKNANMSRVQITRAEGEKSKTTLVDASKSNTPEGNPALMGRDNIYVPAKGAEKRRIGMNDVYSAIVVVYTLFSIFGN